MDKPRITRNQNALRIPSTKEASTSNDNNNKANDQNARKLDDCGSANRKNDDGAWSSSPSLARGKKRNIDSDTDDDNDAKNIDTKNESTDNCNSAHLDSRRHSTYDHNFYHTPHSPDYSPDNTSEATAATVKHAAPREEHKRQRKQRIDDNLPVHGDKLRSIVSILSSKLNKLTTSGKANVGRGSNNRDDINYNTATYHRGANPQQQQRNQRKNLPNTSASAAVAAAAAVDCIYGRDWKGVGYLKPDLARHYVPDERYEQEPLVSLVSIADDEHDRAGGCFLLQQDESVVIVDDGCHSDIGTNEFVCASEEGGSSVGGSVVVCDNENNTQDTVAGSSGDDSSNGDVLNSRSTLCTVFPNTASTATVNELTSVLTPSTRIDVKNANKTPLVFTPTVRHYHQYVIRFTDIAQMCDKCFYPDCVCFAKTEHQTIMY